MGLNEYIFGPLILAAILTIWFVVDGAVKRKSVRAGQAAWQAAGWRPSSEAPAFRAHWKSTAPLGRPQYHYRFSQNSAITGAWWIDRSPFANPVWGRVSNGIFMSRAWPDRRPAFQVGSGGNPPKAKPGQFWLQGKWNPLPQGQGIRSEPKCAQIATFQTRIDAHARSQGIKRGLYVVVGAQLFSVVFESYSPPTESEMAVLNWAAQEMMAL